MISLKGFSIPLEAAVDPAPALAKRAHDMHSSLVCRDPNIWVFDELLSEGFLSHVDELFRSDHLPEACMSGRKSRSVELDLDTATQSAELFDVIRKIAPVREVGRWRTAVISEISGATQDAHMDHVRLSDLSRQYREEIGFLDLGKQSIFNGGDAVVPTFSVVVYFNAVGGITFPSADMQDKAIPGKRGRIIMFQNYTDSQRPLHNPRCMHYGSYLEHTPKRVMTMGILANMTPSVLGASAGSHGGVIGGLLYCPRSLDRRLEHFPDWSCALAARLSCLHEEKEELFDTHDFDGAAAVVEKIISAQRELWNCDDGIAACPLPTDELERHEEQRRRDAQVEAYAAEVPAARKAAGRVVQLERRGEELVICTDLAGEEIASITVRPDAEDKPQLFWQELALALSVHPRYLPKVVLPGGELLCAHESVQLLSFFDG